jgi:hypothetical protein
MDTERRRRRSSSADLATHYQLEQVIQDFDLDTVVLTDEAGQLVAGVGRDSAFAQMLARETPRLAVGSHCRLLYARLNQHRPSVRPNQISACEFRTAGRRYYICAVGSATTSREVGMYRAILGIRRIIAAA